MPNLPAQILRRSWSRRPRHSRRLPIHARADLRAWLSRFAWRWIAPTVRLAIGSGHRFRVAPLEPASYFALSAASRTRPDDFAVGDDSPSAENSVRPFGSPGPVTDTYDTGAGSERGRLGNGGQCDRKADWEKNRFVQLASRELLKPFRQTEKLFDCPTVPPGTVAETRAPAAARQTDRRGRRTRLRGLRRGRPRATRKRRRWRGAAGGLRFSGRQGAIGGLARPAGSRIRPIEARTGR